MHIVQKTARVGLIFWVYLANFWYALNKKSPSINLNSNFEATKNRPLDCINDYCNRM